MSQVAKFIFNNSSDTSHEIALLFSWNSFLFKPYEIITNRCSVIFISLLAGLADCSWGVNLTRGIEFYGGETERVDVLHMNDES